MAIQASRQQSPDTICLAAQLLAAYISPVHMALHYILASVPWSILIPSPIREVHQWARMDICLDCDDLLLSGSDLAHDKMER